MAERETASASDASTRSSEQHDGVFCGATVVYTDSAGSVLYECLFPASHLGPHADGHGYAWPRLTVGESSEQPAGNDPEQAR